MNRAEYIKRYLAFIKEVGLQPINAPVGAGGSLLLMGLRAETSDIDVAIPKSSYDALLNKRKS